MILKKWIAFVLASVMVIAAVPAMTPDEAFAASKKSKAAMAAYRELLNIQMVADNVCGNFGGSLQDAKFALIDLNKDGVSEMVLTADDEYHSALIAYVGGKARTIGSGFSGSTSYYPNKHLYFSSTIHTGWYDDRCYQFNGKKLVKLAEKYGCDYQDAVTGKQKTTEEIEESFASSDPYAPYAPYLYIIKGKKVTENKYKDYIKSLKKGAKEQKLSFIANTSKNRDRYLVSSKLPTKKQSAIRSFVNKNLSGYLDYYATFDHEKKALKGNAFKTDIAIFYTGGLKFTYKDIFGYDGKYPSYSGYGLTMTKTSKKAIKKTGKKLFGKSFNPQYVTFKFKHVSENNGCYNEILSKYYAFFYLTKNKKYLLDYRADTGDYGSLGGITGITQNKGIYTVTYAGNQCVYFDYENLGNFSYTIKLKKTGKRFVITSISYKE